MAIPNRKHYCIITEHTRWVPSDERSRTHPGHGFPQHSVEETRYQAFELDQREEWAEKVRQMSMSQQVFRAGMFVPADVRVLVNVEFE